MIPNEELVSQVEAILCGRIDRIIAEKNGGAISYDEAIKKCVMAGIEVTGILVAAHYEAKLEDLRLEHREELRNLAELEGLKDA